MAWLAKISIFDSNISEDDVAAAAFSVGGSFSCKDQKVGFFLPSIHFSTFSLHIWSSLVCIRCSLAIPYQRLILLICCSLF